MTDPEVSHWFTGEVIRMCNCGGPTLPVYTDGRHKYARCDICGKTWDAETLAEKQKEAKT